MKILGLLICVLMLAGCESEVDKCAKAWMRDYAKTEAEARYICLQVQAKKQ